MRQSGLKSASSELARSGQSATWWTPGFQIGGLKHDSVTSRVAGTEVLGMPAFEAKLEISP